MSDAVYYYHKFVDHTYPALTICDVCDKPMHGLIRQGRKCKRCSLNVHTKCQDGAVINCKRILPGCHVFVEMDYHQTTYCDHCGQLMVGMVLQGLHCKECKVNIHHTCEDSTPQSCVLTKRNSRFRLPASSRSLLPQQKPKSSFNRTSFYGTMKVLNSWKSWKNMVGGTASNTRKGSLGSSEGKSQKFVEMSELLNVDPPDEEENFLSQHRRLLGGIGAVIICLTLALLLALLTSHKHKP